MGWPVPSSGQARRSKLVLTFKLFLRFDSRQFQEYSGSTIWNSVKIAWLRSAMCSSSWLICCSSQPYWWHCLSWDRRHLSRVNKRFSETFLRDYLRFMFILIAFYIKVSLCSSKTSIASLLNQRQITSSWQIVQLSVHMKGNKYIKWQKRYTLYFFLYIY